MENEIITPPDMTAITEAQRAILTQRTPPNVIRHRPGPTGKILSYVEHAWVTEQLNLAFAWNWSWELLDWKLLPCTEDPTEAFVLGRLTIHTPKGDITKTQFGSAAIKRNKQNEILSIGDDLKAASSDALKKSASLLGLALDLYKSEDDDSATNSKTKTKTNGNGKSDPMTAYWIAARERGLTTEQGRAMLQKAGGDPVKAIALLLE